MDVIHQAKIVHSDLKPANFLMAEGELKLIDFGIAKPMQHNTTSIVRESQVRRSMREVAAQCSASQRMP